MVQGTETQARLTSDGKVSGGQRGDGVSFWESAGDRGSNCDVENENGEFRLLMMKMLESCSLCNAGRGVWVGARCQVRWKH
jgi:hypothetical protein